MNLGYLEFSSYCEIASRVVPLFAAGIELRQKRHQDWLLSNLDARIAETGFHALKFLREGVQFAYLKLEGMRIGRFINIKEGAASRYAFNPCTPRRELYGLTC